MDHYYLPGGGGDALYLFLLSWLFIPTIVVLVEGVYLYRSYNSTFSLGSERFTEELGKTVVEDLIAKFFDKSLFILLKDNQQATYYLVFSDRGRYQEAKNTVQQSLETSD